MGKLIDLTGQVFGRLTVLERVETKKKATLWRCRCTCGKESIVQMGNLRNGHTTSCGRCNTIFKHNGYGECKLKDGQSFIFDKEDTPLVESRNWWIGSDGYVIGSDGKRSVRFHRLVMNVSPSSVVDHINGDPKDCRKCNLRIVSQHQNCMNHSLNKNSTTGYKGVCFDKRYQKYFAHIHPNRKMVFLGYFDSPVDAALAYDRAASFYFGEYAKLNFRKDQELLKGR